MSFRSGVRVIFSFVILVFLISIVAGVVEATIIVKNVQNAQGSSYRSVNDSIGVNATSTSNLSMGGTPCVSRGNNVYICVITDKILTATASYQLSNTEGQLVSASIKVDNGIAAISYTTKNSASGVSLDYAVTDSGFNNNNLCSGIKSLTVYDGETEINSIFINGTAGNCQYIGTIPLTLSSSGTKSIKLKATDNVGNTRTTAPQNITVDLNAPEIINGLTIRQSGTTNELEAISGSATFLVDVYFSIREDNLASIQIDLSGINNNPAVQYAYKNFNLPLTNCKISNSSVGIIKVHDCIVRGVPMKLPTGSLNVKINAIDTYGANTSMNLSKSFTVDNVVPQVSIKTDKCDSARCYIHDGKNNIIISLNKDNFEKKLVFYTISGASPATNKVYNCTGGECTGTVQISCTSGSQIDVSISSSGGFTSQDDAGNAVSPYNTYFYCDNTDPDIESINVTGQTSSVIRELVSGSNIKIEARVKEAETDELTANVYLDKIKNATEKGDCERIDNAYFNCVWNINKINDGYYDAEIVVNATDIVGNSDSLKHAVKVFGFKSDNETPDNLAISLDKVYPSGINRIVLDMATGNGIPFFVYATYDLSVVKGNDVEVLYQRLDISKCSYVSDSGTVAANRVFLDAKVTNEYAGLNELSRIDLKFHEQTDPNILDDEFEIVCNISATVKEGDYIYKNPQELELRMPFKLSNTKLCNEGQECTPGERIGKKIKDAEDNFLVRAEILGTVGAIIPKIQQICNLRGYITQGTAGAQILSMAANAVSIGTQNAEIGKVPIQVYLKLSNLDACFSGSGTRGSTQMYGSPAGQNYANSQMGRPGTQATFTQGQTPEQNARGLAGLFGNNAEARANIAKKCSEFVGEACDFLSCAATEDAQKLTNEEIAADKTARVKEAEAAGGKGAFGRQTEDILTRNVDKSDYRNSAVMAAANGCWPAVLYNVNKWRQSECNYVYCLKMAAYSGTDVSACEAAKKTQTCSLIVGEVFELPGARIYKNYAENAADYVKNFFPLAASSILHKQLCPEYVSADSVLSGEKLSPPNTITEQTFKIYGCQLPLQLARLADSNMRSNMRGDGNFVYPEMPDMCIYAKCVGEANCEYEPDFWDTLNKMRINGPKNNQNKINQDRNKQVALQAENEQKLRDLNKLATLSNKGQLNAEGVTTYNNLAREFKDKGQLEDIDLLAVDDAFEICNPPGSSKCDNFNYKITDSELSDLRKYQTLLHNCRVRSQYGTSTTGGLYSDGPDCSSVLKMVDPKLLEKDSLEALTYTDTDEKGNAIIGDKNIQQRYDLYTKQSQTLNELEYIDSKLGLGSDTILDPDYLVPMPNGEILTVGQLNDRRINYYQQLGLCTNNCQSYIAGLDNNPEELAKRNTAISERRDEANLKAAQYGKAVKSYKQAEQFGNALYTGLQYLNAQKMLEWMYSDYWTEKWFGDKFSNYVDPTKWKESLCNPANPINVGGISGEDYVISCSSGQCRPVLSYTAERTLLEYPNGTSYYIYTAVYYISGGDLRGRDTTKFNVYMYGDGTTIKGYKDDTALQAFDTVQKKTVFISPVKYNRICMQFSEPFPPDNSLENAHTYCRSIVENGFNTGSPWTPEEEEAVGGYTNHYDSEGNRVRASDTNNNVDDTPPGFFESGN